jgi:hypothetical protein
LKIWSRMATALEGNGEEDDLEQDGFSAALNGDEDVEGIGSVSRSRRRRG